MSADHKWGDYYMGGRKKRPWSLELVHSVNQMLPSFNEVFDEVRLIDSVLCLKSVLRKHFTCLHYASLSALSFWHFSWQGFAKFGFASTPYLLIVNGETGGLQIRSNSHGVTLAIKKKTIS